ncbi:MAG: YjjG family noncanonical pyrimidine nucleotidase [bacterium]
MYTTVLLDLDDTLWDFSKSAKISLQQMYNELKLSRWFDSVEQFITIYKVKNTQMWEEYGRGEITKEFLALERFAHPLREVNCSEMELAQKMSEIFLGLTNKNLVLIDGAVELLEYLNPKYKLAAVSNGFVEAQYVKLDSSGLGKYFSHIILSEEIGLHKPDVKFFEKALQITATNRENAVVIGDNFDSDVLGAQNAGIDAIYFDRGLKGVKNISNSIKMVSELCEIATIL